MQHNLKRSYEDDQQREDITVQITWWNFTWSKRWQWSTIFHRTCHSSSFTNRCNQLMMFFSPIWFSFRSRLDIFKYITIFSPLFKSLLDHLALELRQYISKYVDQYSISPLNDLFTCAVRLVALYGTSESLARCFPASNTLRFLLVTFRQIAWCFFYNYVQIEFNVKWQQERKKRRNSSLSVSSSPCSSSFLSINYRELRNRRQRRNLIIFFS